jgi:hypothetical protein
LVPTEIALRNVWNGRDEYYESVSGVGVLRARNRLDHDSGGYA